MQRIYRLITEAKKNKIIKFWFRDDDMGYYTPNVDLFLEVFRAKKQPIHIAAIPDRLEGLTIEKIKMCSGAIVLQHGFNHNDNSNYDEDKSEFPQSNPYDISVSNIKKGKQILKNVFQERFINVFVAPWHELSEKVERWCFEEFDSVSNFDYDTNSRIIVNCNVDLIDWSKDDKFGGVEFVYNQIEALFDDKNEIVIGVMSHHRTMGQQGINFINELVCFLVKNDISIISPWEKK